MTTETRPTSMNVGHLIPPDGWKRIKKPLVLITYTKESKSLEQKGVKVVVLKRSNFTEEQEKEARRDTTL